jgi:hypothetical protein
MQSTVEAQPVTDRELEEVLLSLEADLFGSRKSRREREDATIVKPREANESSQS